MAIWTYLRNQNTLDIKVGYSCNNQCIHCVVDPIRADLVSREERMNLTTREIIALIDQAYANRIMAIVLTGGEVTIRRDFDQIIRYAADKGIAITIQTNGRMLADKENCRVLADIPDLFLIVAIHGPGAAVHDAITLVQGSFQQTVEAIHNLRQLDRRMSAKIVISKLNDHCLFETVQFAHEIGVNEASIAFPHAVDFSSDDFYRIVPTYNTISSSIEQIAAYSAKMNFWVDFETLPYCVLPDSPHFWRRNCDLLSRARMSSERADGVSEFVERQMEWEIVRPSMKRKPATCESCLFDPLCEGPWIEYVEHYGSAEFQPVTNEGVLTLLL